MRLVLVISALASMCVGAACHAYSFDTPIAVSEAEVRHGGGLNSQGCHNDHRRGTYHCH